MRTSRRSPGLEILALCVCIWTPQFGCVSLQAGAEQKSYRIQPHSLQALQKETKNLMDSFFEKAMVSTGPEYLAVEMSLRRGGAEAITTLRKNLENPDPVARLLARVQLDWIEGRGPEYVAALEYLDTLPEQIAETPKPSPSPLGVAAYLTMHFKERVVDLLALRLLKGADWPHWRVTGVLFYLKDQKRPSTTAALIRYSAETQNDKWRGYAIDAIRETKDPQLRAKLKEEAQRLQALGKALPNEVQELHR